MSYHLRPNLHDVYIYILVYYIVLFYYVLLCYIIIYCDIMLQHSSITRKHPSSPTTSARTFADIPGILLYFVLCCLEEVVFPSREYAVILV